MYNSIMFKRLVYRSPDAGESAGEIESGAGEVIPAAGEGESAAQAPDYVRSQDFNAFAERMEANFAKLTPAQQAAQEVKPSAPSQPDLNDTKKYDFKNDPNAAARYQQDFYKFMRSIEKTEEAAEKAKSDAAEKLQSNEKGHNARFADYTKSNPEFAADLKAAAGKINVTEPVKLAIYGSKNGPLAIHYMAKNAGAAQELNVLADSEGPEAVRERIGEMAAEMRKVSKETEAVALAAGQKPPRQNLKANAGSSDRSPSPEERYARHHGLK